MTLATPTISIRATTPADGPVLARLAALDSAPIPFGAVLLAEVDGEPRAALNVRDGRVIADPFTRTSELVSLLRVHAAALTDQVRRSTEAEPGFGRRLGLAA